MKIRVVNTARGLLVPESEEDYEKRKKLIPGETYEVDIRIDRNGDFHRKFMKMFSVAFNLLPEYVKPLFHDAEGLRASILITVGYSTTVWLPRLQEFGEIPKSMSYEAIDQTEIEELYIKVRRALDSILSKYITPQQFDQYFMDF